MRNTFQTDARHNLARLNYRPAQHPPDTYYIKSARNTLAKHLEDPGLTKQLRARATPRQKARYDIFSITHYDLARLDNRDWVDKTISRHDPYVERMSSVEQKRYKYMHPGC